MTDQTICPTSHDQRHQFTVSVGSGQKSDFEPVSFGDSAAETLYRRVEYSYLACRFCALVSKQRVRVDV